jgi:hypothetical protein
MLARRGEDVTELFQRGSDLRNWTLRERRPNGTMPTRMARPPKPPSCEDCFFHKNLLCALELTEPCATFRPNRPEGLVPPKQPVLLMRAPRWASQTRPA